MRNSITASSPASVTANLWHAFMWIKSMPPAWGRCSPMLKSRAAPQPFIWTLYDSPLIWLPSHWSGDPLRHTFANSLSTQANEGSAET